MVLFQSKLNQRCRRRQPEVIKANDQSSNHMENLTVSGITLVCNTNRRRCGTWGLLGVIGTTNAATDYTGVACFTKLEKATLLNSLRRFRVAWEDPRRSRALSRCAFAAEEERERVSSWTPPPPAPWTASTCPPCCYLLAFDVQDSSSTSMTTHE